MKFWRRRTPDSSDAAQGDAATQRRGAPHRGWIVVVVVVVIIAGVVTFAVRSASISALATPGSVETAVANRAKDYFIRRDASQPMPTPPPHSAAEIAKGQALFGMDCATCHGQDGRHPAPIGQSMYPRAVDLGSEQVQGLSGRELYWVIHNGIRFTGMPGFGRINSPQEIWELDFYVHTLGAPPQPAVPASGQTGARKNPPSGAR